MVEKAHKHVNNNIIKDSLKLNRKQINKFKIV